MDKRYYRMSNIRVVDTRTIAGIVDLGFYMSLSTVLTMVDSSLIDTLDERGTDEAIVGLVGHQVVSIDQFSEDDDRLWQYPLVEVLKVVDGDTLDASLDVGFSLVSSSRFRLSHIDTYELRGGTSDTKALAQLAKRFVEDVFSGSSLGPSVFRTKKTEKYGRWLADIYLGDGTYLNELIERQGNLTKPGSSTLKLD